MATQWQPALTLYMYMSVHIHTVGFRFVRWGIYLCGIVLVFVVDGFSETTITRAHLGYINSVARAAYVHMALMRANQLKTAVCHLPGLLQPTGFDCVYQMDILFPCVILTAQSQANAFIDVHVCVHVC